MADTATSNAIVTVKTRNKMMRSRAGEITLPKIEGMAFGNGGVDASGQVIAPDEKQETLTNELLRKPIDGYKILTETSCRYECTLEKPELAGESISEIALYDTDGDLVAIKNFMPKGKDGDLEMTFQLDDVF